MDGRVLRLLAVLLALGSLAIGFIGFQLSERQVDTWRTVSPYEPTTPTDTKPVVVAKAGIPPGRPIRSDDLAVVAFPATPPASYSKTDDLVGKTTTLPVAAGELLLERHFLPGSSLARAVRPGERAIAVKVDEVVAGGGLVHPGDYVDVLLYLRGGNQELAKSSALPVLRNVRVLAYGEVVIDGESGDKEKPASARSVVLAVPLEETTALMLAASAGSLRLAVYGVQESQALAAGMTSLSTSAPAVTLHELTRQPRSRPEVERGASINVFRGVRKEVVQAK